MDVVYDLSRAPQSLSEAAGNQKHADIQTNGMIMSVILLLNNSSIIS